MRVMACVSLSSVDTVFPSSGAVKLILTSAQVNGTEADYEYEEITLERVSVRSFGSSSSCSHPRLSVCLGRGSATRGSRAACGFLALP